MLELGFVTMRIPAREVLGNMEGVILGIVEHCLQASIDAVAHHLAPVGVLTRRAAGAQQCCGLGGVEQSAERPGNPRGRKAGVERIGVKASDARKSS